MSKQICNEFDKKARASNLQIEKFVEDIAICNDISSSKNLNSPSKSQRKDSPWTEQDDEALLKIVNEHRDKHGWDYVASKM